MRKFSFVTIDVFSTRALEGNPVAVFVDARGLSDSEMQAIAREMNLSETTFIFPRDEKTEREHGIQTRIFTIAEELPFAGHPTLGTAAVLARSLSVNEVVLDLKVGKIPVRFTNADDGLFGEMTQRDPEFGSIHARDQVAEATGLAVSDFDASLPIQTVSTGVAFAIVPIRSLGVIAKLEFDLRRAYRYLEMTDAKFFYFVTKETTTPDAGLHARMLFYGGDDPATGSAAGCTAAWMVRHGVAQPDQQVIIEQGLEVGRPSRIFVRASLDGSRVHNVRVGGFTVEVMRGELSIP